MVNQKVVIGVFSFQIRPIFELTLLFHRFLAIFLFLTNDGFLPVFRKTTSFWMKLGSQIFLNIRPCALTKPGPGPPDLVFSHRQL